MYLLERGAARKEKKLFTFERLWLTLSTFIANTLADIYSRRRKLLLDKRHKTLTASRILFFFHPPSHLSLSHSFYSVQRWRKLFHFPPLCQGEENFWIEFHAMGFSLQCTHKRRREAKWKFSPLPLSKWFSFLKKAIFPREKRARRISFRGKFKRHGSMWIHLSR